jgi:uncharacterized protein YoxC
MLTLFEVCAVVASLAVVAIAVAAVRMMSRVDKATNQISKLTGEIQLWVGQGNALTREAREIVHSVRGVIAPIRRVVDRFEAIGDRTASLSAALLGEVEAPIHTAVAVARGVRSVTAHFMERLSHRFTQGRPATNGGSEGKRIRRSIGRSMERRAAQEQRS